MYGKLRQRGLEVKPSDDIKSFYAVLDEPATGAAEREAAMLHMEKVINNIEGKERVIRACVSSSAHHWPAR